MLGDGLQSSRRSLIFRSYDQTLTAQPLCVPIKKRERQVDCEHQPFKNHSGINCWDFQKQHHPCACYGEVIVGVGGVDLLAIDQHL